MAWPAGFSIAGKPYRSMDHNELVGAANMPLIVPTLTTTTLQVIPWWSGGYRRARMTMGFTMAAVGNVLFLMRGTSRPDAGANTPSSAIVNGATGENFPIGSSQVDWAWDDTQLPGNYQFTQVVPVAAKSMPLNPIWNKAAMLELSIQNNSAGNFQLDSLYILLGG